MRRWTNQALILGCWAVIGLAYSSHLYVYHNLQGEPTTWLFQLAEAFADFSVWAALTPLILALARRFPLFSRAWPKSLLVHVPAALLVSAVQVALHTVLDMGFIHWNWTVDDMAAGLRQLTARTYHFGLLVYFAVVAVQQAIAYYQDQAVRASQLEARLALAELQALKMQLHPHFLFNTLHAVSALMQRDVKAADQMIARLSEFLRMSLEAGGVQEVTLRRELEFLERYLEIEKIRFRDRLTVATHVAPEALDARVPNLILQPLVENAIRHGISKRRGAGRVEITALRENGTLELAVRDDGPGFPESGVVDEGIGLSNTRLRLEQLYGSRHRFEITNAPSGGLVVSLGIPFRT
jgi:two-component system, LytTR family, sensor kinase